MSDELAAIRERDEEEAERAWPGWLAAGRAMSSADQRLAYVAFIAGFREARASAEASVAALREAWDGYREATAGRGHVPEPHNTELATLLGMNDRPRREWSSVDEQRACSACAGAEYGTEADLASLMDSADTRAAAEAHDAAIRRDLGARLGAFEDLARELVGCWRLSTSIRPEAPTVDWFMRPVSDVVDAFKRLLEPSDA